MKCAYSILSRTPKSSISFKIGYVICFVSQYLMAWLFVTTSLQKSQNAEITSTTDSVYTSGTTVTVPFLCKSEEPDFITKSVSSPPISSGTVDRPVDLSTRKENDADSTSQGKI